MVSPSLKSAGLKPVLKTALMSLDLSLDKELARFEQERIGKRPSNATESKSVATTRNWSAAQGMVALRKVVTGTSGNPDGALTVRPTSFQPNGYLASSQGLLQELSNETPLMLTAVRPWHQQLRSPLSIGAFCIIAATTTLLGWSYWRSGSTFAGTSAPSSSHAFDNESNASASAIRELEKLTTESDATTDHSSAETSKASSLASPSGTARPSKAQAAAPNQPVASSTADSKTEEKSPTETASSNPPEANDPPAVDVPPTPVNQQLVYVVTPYQGEESLTKARQVIGDAFLVNFPLGIRIQLGAFVQASDADRLIQTLQENGVKAVSYTPKDLPESE